VPPCAGTDKPKAGGRGEHGDHAASSPALAEEGAIAVMPVHDAHSFRWLCSLCPDQVISQLRNAGAGAVEIV
jgi:hypothetical protein